MKKLTQAHLAERQSLLDQVDAAKQHLEDKVTEFNKEVKVLFRHGPAEALDELNTSLENLRQWANNLMEETQEYFDDKPAEWQESPAGEAYQEWSTSFDDAASKVDDVEIDEPEELLYDEVDVSSIEDLEEEPSDV